MQYRAIIHKEYIVQADTEEDARDEAIHVFDLDYEEVKIECIGEE